MYQQSKKQKFAILLVAFSLDKSLLMGNPIPHQPVRGFDLTKTDIPAFQSFTSAIESQRAPVDSDVRWRGTPVF